MTNWFKIQGIHAGDDPRNPCWRWSTESIILSKNLKIKIKSFQFLKSVGKGRIRQWSQKWLGAGLPLIGDDVINGEWYHMTISNHDWGVKIRGLRSNLENIYWIWVYRKIWSAKIGSQLRNDPSISRSNSFTACANTKWYFAANGLNCFLC